MLVPVLVVNGPLLWTCTENNLTLPMNRFGYWIDVCEAYPVGWCRLTL
jgi:hypothetical protein